ncbi:macrophage mannose receptor 1-like [Cloeon dipterum]|uniref:macrophage mannose receptor 1-like n=1 Tax=Cloeon dipterum TaxID=197152 RepID=UPI00321F9CEB
MAVRLVVLAFIVLSVSTAESSPFSGDFARCSGVLEKMNIAVLETGTYLIPTQELNWQSAVQYCKKFDSSLVQIESAREAEIAFNGANNGTNPPGQFWTLGTNRARTDKNFVWAVKVPGIPIDNSLWLPGEPSNAQNKSPLDCLSASLRSGGLADNDCNDDLRPICELPKDVNNCEKLFELLRIKTLETGTYLFTEKFYDWHNASKLCDGLGMEIAIVDNIDEINIVYQEAVKLFPDNERFWIGGLDKGVKGTYVWTNNKPVDSNLWIKKHPAHAEEEEPACITLRKNGLGDCPCSVGRRSICKVK